MLELRRPLSFVLDGPGLLVQRLTAMIPQDLRNLDLEFALLAMAENDPDSITYLNSENLLRRPRPETDEEAWQS